MMDLVQVAQHADDLYRAQAFYENLLGAPASAVFDPPGLVFFRVGATRLLLDQAAPTALVYLGVDDLAATVERLRASGVEIHSEPHVIFRHEEDALGPAGTDEQHAFVRDSEGNLVGLVAFATG
jgi:predicted enzyme related to lactoylglutathione lyase